MPNYIKRQIEPLFLSWLEKPEVIFLTGARQVGKTTFLKKISTDLEKEGRSVIFVNVEEAETRKKLASSPQHFLQQVISRV